MNMSIMLIRNLTHQMCLKHDQLRTFRNIWLKVYKGGWQASPEQVLIDRIKLKLKEIDLNFLQLLMKGIKAKLRSIADDGVFSFKKQLISIQK